MFKNKFLPLLYWGTLLTFVVVNGYLLLPIFRYLRPTITLIVTAALLAFLLNYPVRLLMSWQFKRSHAVGVVFLLALIILVTMTGLKSVWLGVEVLVVATIIDQGLDQAIAPRIFGDLVGLNPVWIIISLLLGAKLGGVLGLILAVPLAGAIKRFANSLRTETSEAVNLSE